ncbi:hypothetical protein [Saccharothrix sp.]|uniref:hypothetical protein n=1 Tax=Saccharothrix sp. TaxID=1873460 RepID=UPI002811504E|nr:hypothetical protein [Saccharothrix sp.]
MLLDAQAHAVLVAFHKRTAHLCDGTLPLLAGSYVYVIKQEPPRDITAVLVERARQDSNL